MQLCSSIHRTLIWIIASENVGTTPECQLQSINFFQKNTNVLVMHWLYVIRRVHCVERLCSMGESAIWALTLTVRGATLVVSIWRLWIVKCNIWCIHESLFLASALHIYQSVMYCRLQQFWYLFHSTQKACRVYFSQPTIRRPPIPAQICLLYCRL